MTRLRLLGYPVSNYVNIVRAALIEKQLDCEFVPTRSSQDAEFRLRSPMGKIPLLETPAGPLSETVAILDWLDDAYPAPSLRPEHPFERARARQLVNIVQMYVEAPVRSLFAGVFVAGETPSATIGSVRAMLDRSTAALAQLMRPAPFLFGDRPGQADLFAFYNLDIAERVTRFVYGRSISDEIGHLDEWIEAMHARASTRTVLGDFAPAFAAYLADHDAPYREDEVRRPLSHA
jgi:glutathione S-transferase